MRRYAILAGRFDGGQTWIVPGPQVLVSGRFAARLASRRLRRRGLVPHVRRDFTREWATCPPATD